MPVTVRLYGTLRALLKTEILVERDQPATLRGLIDLLATRDQRIAQELLTEDHDLDHSYAVFLRGERVATLDTPLGSEDEVVITSMIAGGSATSSNYIRSTLQRLV